ncbi:hypothetical protein LTS18_014850, partial [Coniosporium uncinatum]
MCQNSKGDNICGLCMVTDWESDEQYGSNITSHVTHDDSEQSPATWVECSVRTCRAQYVVYNPSQLNVKPKCHYCPQQSELDAPSLECTNCLNRIIWPTALRPDGFETSFNCYACNSGRSTIIKEGITANTLRTENGIAWLLRNSNQAIKNPS